MKALRCDTYNLSQPPPFCKEIRKESLDKTSDISHKFDDFQTFRPFSTCGKIPVVDGFKENDV